MSQDEVRYEPQVTADLSPGTFRDIIFADNAEIQAQFTALFGQEIDRVCEALSDAYVQFLERGKNVRREVHPATVQFFLHVAINSVVFSLHHLVSGYPIASGNMMRHYTEAVAMAMMCAVNETGVYAVYDDDRGNYPVHKAPTMIKRKKIKSHLQEALAFDPSAWDTVLEIAELYESLSHVSALTLAYHMLFTEEGGVVIGGEFDPAKIAQYRSDVVRRRSAAESLAHLIPIIMDVLPAP